MSFIRQLRDKFVMQFDLLSVIHRKNFPFKQFCPIVLQNLSIFWHVTCVFVDFVDNINR
jgi:hypothetical protein